MEMPFWMVRAEGGTLIDLFLSKGVVAIGWHEAGDLSNVETRDGALRLVEKKWPESLPAARAVWAGVLFRFRREVAVGQGAVTYDPSRRIYHVGEITSDYRYNPGLSGDWPNQRTVKWVSEISRDDLSVNTKNLLGSAVALFRLSETAAREFAAKIKGEPNPQPGEEEPGERDLLKDIQSKSREFIKDKINRLDWEQMQDLVAGLLRAMGYKTRVSPSGSDLGKDIVASPDGFGLDQPRIVVEVKHRNKAIDSKDIRGFLGGRHKDDKGLYVSTGGFTKDAKYEADRASIPITLIDLDDLVTSVLEHYEEMDTDTKALIPLVKIYWPA